MKAKHLILAVVLAAIGSFVAWDYLSTPQTPAGQPPLAEMNLGTLRAQFNESSDCVRLVALLSPT